MSDHAVQSDHDSDGTGRQSTHSHQSVWMAHWKHPSYKPETHGHDPSSIHYQCRGDDGDIKQHRPESLPGISESSKGFREVSESRTVNIMNDSLKPSLINFRKERLESQSFPMFHLSENRERRMSQKNVTSCAGVVSEMGTSSREFRPKGISASLEQQQLNSHESVLKKSVAISTSNQHDVGPNSKIVPFIYNKGKTPVHSFVCGQEEIYQSSSVVASKDHLTNAKFQSYSTTPLINKDKLYNPIDFRSYGTSSSSRQNNLSLLLHNPSVSNNQVPVCVGKLSEKMQNGSGTRLFPDWNCPLDKSKSETLFHNFYSVPRIPLSLQDAETMRICATVDSARELSPSPEYSQTTHSFLITKKSDVNLSEGGERFKDSTFSTNFDGKMVHKFLNLSPDFGFHAQQSLKLEPLQSSTDSEGKENFGDAKTDAVCLKNESSADTDTMDMDVFDKGHLSAGVVSSPKNKIVKRGLISSTLQAEIASSREETGGGLPKTELPDINEELPALPAVASSVEDGETSSSRTQSLDVEHLLSHAELPINSKSGAFPDGVEVSDPSSRWVKRLKPSASGSSPYGTKSSKMEEACSHEKVNRFFSKIMRGGVTSSESTMSKHPGKEQTALDQTTVLLRNGEPSSSESERKSRDISLANPWIQRLCHQRASPMKKNREAVVVCEPQKLNATLDEFQKKQFPSVAAMAMMGKALNSIRPCGFTKKGPYVVWQT